ncbi:uncharacterized protein B0P05DRAFT_559044, partial [Gilbertella persicaria]|uniref:uncharacterized protein n=1 Tax=Gilbertella persicaria TaxID=101096 RepID=UPI0022212223
MQTKCIKWVPFEDICQTYSQNGDSCLKERELLCCVMRKMTPYYCTHFVYELELEEFIC